MVIAVTSNVYVVICVVVSDEPLLDRVPAVAPACECLVRMTQNCIENATCQAYSYGSLLPCVLQHCLNTAVSSTVPPFSSINKTDEQTHASIKSGKEGEGQMSSTQITATTVAESQTNEQAHGKLLSSRLPASVCDKCVLNECADVTSDAAKSVFNAEEILAVLLKLIRCCACHSDNR